MAGPRRARPTAGAGRRTTTPKRIVASAARRPATSSSSRVAASPRRRVAVTLRRFFGLWLLAKVAALAILVGGAALATQVVHSQQFQVAEVVVSGSGLVAAEDIAATIDVAGVNAFTIRGRHMARVIQADPAIESASVRARLPDAVEVIVYERAPAVLWEANGRTLIADETGLALRDGTRPDLPIIHAPEGPAPDAGGRVDAEIVRMAQSLAPRLEAEGLAGGQFEYRPTTGASIVLPDALRIALGSLDELEEKLAAYQAIRAHLDQTHTEVRFIDVRFLERPYFR
jgi:POTRA domain, FtsQ-type/Cell division protein FtsQ